MPWCPKCRSEYRAGFTVCKDCGSSLIGEEEFRKLLSAEQAERLEEARRLLENAAQYNEDAAAKEEEDNQEGGENTQQGKTAAERPTGSGRMYQDSAQRAGENRSAALALLMIGIVGLVIVILGMTGVLPFRFSYFSGGVMGAVFILFVAAGIVSMRNAKALAGKAEAEKVLRNTILEWCREGLRAEAIDKEIGAAEGDKPEELYFKRFECIKMKLNRRFVGLDQDFLDAFIDELVYESVFPLVVCAACSGAAGCAGMSGSGEKAE